MSCLPHPVMGKGRIEVIFGPMFSGKTTELIRRITRFQFAKFRCLVFKYEGDKRYSDDDVSTHDSRTIPAVAASSLKDHLEMAKQFDVIGIDEGQFFPDLIPFAEELANAGKTLVVAALDGTFERVGFGNILQLVPIAESVIKLSAVCLVCCGDASFTQRLTEDKGLEIIGGAEKYRAVCRDCYRGVLISPQRQRTPRKRENGMDFNVETCKRALICPDDSSDLVNFKTTKEHGNGEQKGGLFTMIRKVDLRELCELREHVTKTFYMLYPRAARAWGW